MDVSIISWDKLLSWPWETWFSYLGISVRTRDTAASTRLTPGYRQPPTTCACTDQLIHQPSDVSAANIATANGSILLLQRQRQSVAFSERKCKYYGKLRQKKALKGRPWVRANTLQDTSFCYCSLLPLLKMIRHACDAMLAFNSSPQSVTLV